MADVHWMDYLPVRQFVSFFCQLWLKISHLYIPKDLDILNPHNKICAVRVHILPKKGYFFVSLLRKHFYLTQNLFKGTAYLPSPGKRNNTERTEIIAPV